MNKKLLAAAITAGLMVPGLAAADVKIGGVIQAETGNIDRDRQGTSDQDTTLTGAGSNGAINGGGPNQLWFKGSEKLGNGLTAYFKINTQFGTFENNDQSVEERDTFVGVKGKGWHVQFGRMNSLYKTASHKYDPFVATGLQTRATGAVSNLHNAYVNNVGEVGFKSGAWSGGIQIQWEDGENANNVNSGKTLNDIDAGSWNGRVMYKTKTWNASFSYIDQDYSESGEGSVDGWKVAGQWKGNGFTVGVQYEDLNADGNADQETIRHDGSGKSSFFVADAGSYGHDDIEDYDSLAVYVSYKVSGNTSIHGGYATADVERTTGNTDTDIEQWQIGATHKFSKRTSVWGGFTNFEHDENSSGTDYDTDIWSIGLRHKF